MADCRGYFQTALNSDNPMQALGSICALDKGPLVSALSERFGLPHHPSPGAAADRDCVAAAWAALNGGRTGTPMTGAGVAEARKHIDNHRQDMGMGDASRSSADLLETRSEPVEIRSSTITDVNVKQRLIDVVAVPWEQEADILWQGEPWREIWTRGAFSGIEDHAGRVRVNREHVKGMTIGKVVGFTDAEEGELAQVKAAPTPLGDETLALAEDDAISASVGFRLRRPSDMQLNRRLKLRRMLRAFMDHLAMVESPAYVGAQVLGVRAEPSGLQVVEQKLAPTPALDEWMNDDVLAWARTRVNR